jgi:hypothetical protein
LSSAFNGETTNASNGEVTQLAYSQILNIILAGRFNALRSLSMRGRTSSLHNV